MKFDIVQTDAVDGEQSTFIVFLFPCFSHYMADAAEMHLCPTLLNSSIPISRPIVFQPAFYCSAQLCASLAVSMHLSVL